MNHTKIPWTDLSWNPVTGCRHACPYCYARALSRRFGRSFEPTFHPDRLAQPGLQKKAKKIFVCSMADLEERESIISHAWKEHWRGTKIFKRSIDGVIKIIDKQLKKLGEKEGRGR